MIKSSKKKGIIIAGVSAIVLIAVIGVNFNDIITNDLKIKRT